MNSIGMVSLHLSDQIRELYRKKPLNVGISIKNGEVRHG